MCSHKKGSFKHRLTLSPQEMNQTPLPSVKGTICYDRDEWRIWENYTVASRNTVSLTGKSRDTHNHCPLTLGRTLSLNKPYVEIAFGPKQSDITYDLWNICFQTRPQHKTVYSHLCCSLRVPTIHCVQFKGHVIWGKQKRICCITELA